MDIKTVTQHLNAIKRTCLFCNSNEDLADRTGIPSLVNNNNFDKVGSDKRVATFESFNKEYQEYSNSIKVELKDFMEQYEDTSEFYKNNELAKIHAISTKRGILDIIGCIFFSQGLPKDRKVSRFISTIYDHEKDALIQKNVNIPLLILILYRIIPTYTSKGGYVRDISLDYALIKELATECYERFGITDEKTLLELFEKKFDDKRKLNRMALITLFESVINNIYITTNTGSLLDYYRSFDIEGIWIDRMDKDIIYEIEGNSPYYQMTIIHLGKTIATYALYALVITENSNGCLMLETTHPRGRARKLLNEKIGSLDSSAHYVTFDDEDCPGVIELEDIKRHANYDFNASKLYRVTEKEEEELIKRIESLELKDKYEKYQTEYIPHSNIYAITHKFIYISTPSLSDGKLFRIPRDKYSDKGILTINIDDSGGEIVIARQGPYLAFEKIGLYIDVRTEEKMKEAGVEQVGINEII